MRTMALSSVFALTDWMWTVILGVIVAAIYVGVIVGWRSNLHDRAAQPVVLSRGEIRRRLRSIPRSSIRLETSVAYRWKPYDRQNPNDRIPARLLMTDSDLILRPHLGLIALGGLGLFLPSYWIPLDSLRSVAVSEEVKLPLPYNLLAVKGGRRLITVTIESGATCWIRFRSEFEAVRLLEAKPSLANTKSTN